MTDCIFCKIISGEVQASKIYEDDKVLAFLDIKPLNPGHTLVVTKEHFDDLTSTPDELVCAVTKIAKMIGKKIIKSKLGEGFNVGINTKKPAGQVVNHFHLHVMPRLSNDGCEHWKGKDYTAGEEEKSARKLREEL